MLLDTWNALQAGRLPEIGPLASVGTFHHAALPYDLWLPALWLGHGDPLFVVAETALLGTLVVPMVWWVGRSIGGPVAGLVAAYLAAVSAALIGYSVFVWTPTPLEPGGALAVLGAWQAWRSRDPRWWLVAAAGLDVVVQSHIAGPFLGIPLVALYVLDVRRAAGERRRHLLWGAISIGFVAVTYAPYFLYELGHDFTNVRGMIGYFTQPSDSSGLAAPLAIPLVFVRILAWPLTAWPQDHLAEGFVPALLAALGIAASLIWQWRKLHRARLAAAPASELDVERDRREGIAFVGLSLTAVIVAGGAALKDMSLVQRLPTEQYHVWADPLALIAAGLALGVMWRLPGPSGAPRLPRATLVAILAALTAWNAFAWPALVSEDGGYPQAQSAARTIERESASRPFAIVSLFPPENPNAFVYPLTVDGYRTSSVDEASVLVLYCDSSFVDGCDGQAERSWLAQNASSRQPEQIDRFEAGPGRILTLYRLTRP